MDDTSFFYMATYDFQYPNGLFYVVLLTCLYFLPAVDTTEYSESSLPCLACLEGCFSLPCAGLSLLLYQQNAIDTVWLQANVLFMDHTVFSFQNVYSQQTALCTLLQEHYSQKHKGSSGRGLRVVPWGLQFMGVSGAMAAVLQPKKCCRFQAYSKLSRTHVSGQIYMKLS